MSGQLKSKPADFIVQESLDFSFDGEGEHLYLYVRKCCLNTNDVIERLQRQLGCQSVDIGVSGLKDKYAITDQWFSIRTVKDVGDTGLPYAPEFHSSPAEHAHVMCKGEFCVLKSYRHSRKLRRGAHRHNRFLITVRDIVSKTSTTPLPEALDARLRLLQADGFANYFGPQRFGINGQNLPAAERYFANPKRRLSRSKRSLLISAARSQLFNCVCAQRVNAKNWNLPLDGEPMLLDGSHSFFVNNSGSNGDMVLLRSNREAVHVGDTFERCQRHDIHPTGPLWGEGATLAQGDCEEFETSILHLYASLREGLEKVGLKQQRRALRANIENLKWQWLEPTIVTLDFNLLKGVYATSFMSEFMLNSSDY